MSTNNEVFTPRLYVLISTGSDGVIRPRASVNFKPKRANEKEYLSLAESEHLLKKQAEKYEARIAIAVGALGEARKAISFCRSENDRLAGEIYPKIYDCDCEAPCSCKYPAGYVRIRGIRYHCFGSDIEIEEFLAALRAPEAGEKMEDISPEMDKIFKENIGDILA